MGSVCMHCGFAIEWDWYFMELTHTKTGDPQCTNPFTGAYEATWAEKKEDND